MARRRGTATRSRSPLAQCHCGADIWWLRNETTGLVAPINRYPEPGGYCEIDLPARTYVAHPRHVARGLDPTTENIDAQPTLYRRHSDTCLNPRPPKPRPVPGYLDGRD